MEINIEVDYKAVEEAVRRAGMMIKEAHLSADSVQHKEGAANFVTSYDVAIQRFLIDELHRIVPEAAFFGEDAAILAQIFFPPHARVRFFRKIAALQNVYVVLHEIHL